MNFEKISQLKSQPMQFIGHDTVHKICSGQVVLSLAIAVKELVENAIDAGATIIDIHLKEYGSELIEVCDNGKGVMKDNFQFLTLKHYTSKLRQFTDLESIATLGFRGEALSSLCALSELSITTKHELAETGTQLNYDKNGKITSETIIAREVGTSVSLVNLFSTLPVRRKEFLKNLKREFNRMCQLLHAYCLVSNGIKFSCTNLLKNGKRSTVVATNGSQMVRDNIINVFSPKQIALLIEVEPVRPDATILSEFETNLAQDEELPFSFELLISSVMHGNGRSSTDRQFFYINSRPCEPNKLSKLINDIYRQYNSNQFPFVFLNITTKFSLVDVNVTPDKRQIFIEKEKLLLAIIKASLTAVFKTFPSNFKYQNVDANNITKIDFFGGERRALKRNASETKPSRTMGSILERFGKRSKTESDKESAQKEQSLLRHFVSGTKKNTALPHCTNSSFSGLSSSSDLDLMENKEPVVSIEESQMSCPLVKSNGDNINDIATNEEIEVNNKIDLKSSTTENIESTLEKNVYEKNNALSIIDDISDISSKTPDLPKVFDGKKITDNATHEIESQEDFKESTTPKNKEKFIKKTNEMHEVGFVSLEANLSVIEMMIKIRKERREKEDVAKVERQKFVRFRSEITPEANKFAEAELTKQFSKEDFKKMEVIGQFNLGFIIARLNQDLFIIDQHATDEKYNFEQLQANTIIEHQTLIKPKMLELTAGNESILIENEHIFKQNGFKFKIDDSASCTKKVALTAIPMSKNVVFGEHDIDEMLFLLQNTNRKIVRPSRVREMFASRACRKSVMIGSHLAKSEMRKLVDHMGEIEEPWNCPHGRPTMRHLINMDLIQHDLEEP